MNPENRKIIEENEERIYSPISGSLVSALEDCVFLSGDRELRKAHINFFFDVIGRTFYFLGNSRDERDLPRIILKRVQDGFLKRDFIEATDCLDRYIITEMYYDEEDVGETAFNVLTRTFQRFNRSQLARSHYSE